MTTGARKMALRPCPICGEAQADVLHTQRFVLPEGSLLPDRYDVVSCAACLFVYADTPRDQATYDRYYAACAKYDDPQVATGGGDSALDRERLEAMAGLVASRLGPGSRVLDIGCARGGLLAALAARGLSRLHGLDPSPACVAAVREKGLEATLGHATDLDRLGDLGTFDAVVLSHVLEHVVALRATLQSVRRLLAPEGFVYVEVPDACRYLDHPFVPFYYFDAEHINHFDEQSLANLAARCGLRLDAVAQRDLAVNATRTYPALGAFLTGGAGGAPALHPARRLRERVESYVALSRGAEDYRGLAALAAGGRPVAVWGAGSYAQRLFGQSPLGDCAIVAVVDRDRNKHGTRIAGHPVRSPEEGLRGLAPDTVIFVAAAVASEAIVAELRSLGLAGHTILTSAAEAPADA